MKTLTFLANCCITLGTMLLVGVTLLAGDKVAAAANNPCDACLIASYIAPGGATNACVCACAPPCAPLVLPCRAPVGTNNPNCDNGCKNGFAPCDGACDKNGACPASACKCSCQQSTGQTCQCG